MEEQRAADERQTGSPVPEMRRVLSWNMNGGFGSGAARNEQAWQWLAESDPDVALLQEAVLPAWARDLWPVVVHAPKYLTKRWGSAIVSRHNDFEEFRPADDGGHARLPVDGH